MTSQSEIVYFYYRIIDSGSLTPNAYLLNELFPEAKLRIPEPFEKEEFVSDARHSDEAMKLMQRILLCYAEIEPVMLILHLQVNRHIFLNRTDKFQTGTAFKANVDNESWEFAYRIGRHCSERHLSTSHSVSK